MIEWKQRDKDQNFRKGIIIYLVFFLIRFIVVKCVFSDEYVKLEGFWGGFKIF